MRYYIIKTATSYRISKLKKGATGECILRHAPHNSITCMGEIKENDIVCTELGNIMKVESTHYYKSKLLPISDVLEFVA